MAGGGEGGGLVSEGGYGGAEDSPSSSPSPFGSGRTLSLLPKGTAVAEAGVCHFPLIMSAGGAS